MNLFLRNMGLLIMATLLGAVIGLDRERQGKSAGLRTHSLVCLGSALITMVGIYGFGPSGGGLRDPARLAAQIVSGIGFLGAGTIMHEGLTIKGLTTAASLWTTAGIGLAAGAGLVWPAIAATALVEIVLIFFNRLEEKYLPHRDTVLRITAIDRPGLLGEVATIVGGMRLNIVASDIELDRGDSMVRIEIVMGRSMTSAASHALHTDLLQEVLALSGVLRAEVDNW